VNWLFADLSCLSSFGARAKPPEAPPVAPMYSWFNPLGSWRPQSRLPLRTLGSCKPSSSLTHVLDRPVMGRIFFEHVIRENLDIGRPGQVQLILDRG
jgi:hypothetical protein